MISPDLSIGEDPFLIMLTPSVAILCFARIRANPKINLPDSAARMVISVGAGRAVAGCAGWRCGAPVGERFPPAPSPLPVSEPVRGRGEPTARAFWRIGLRVAR